MPSFGILTLNDKQEDRYYREIGKMAASEGVAVHRFAPNRIDPFTEKVTGETYLNGEWVSGTFSIPDVLYDRCFYSTRDSYKTHGPIVEWLKNRTIFLGFGLPNKWKVHEVLKRNPYLNHYTVDTLKAVKAKTILNELEKRTTLLLKPESGSQGKGIFLIDRQAEGYVIRIDRRGTIHEKTFSTEGLLKKWLDVQLSKTPFLIQPFLSLRTEDDRPFDIRVVMQKDVHGNWVERGRGIRVGKEGGFVANLHNEGELEDYKTWLGTLPRIKRSYIQTEIAAITERIPQQLEASIGPLFELGIDLGVDREGAIWILEANSKPGHRTLIEKGKINLEQLALAPLRYGEYLLRQKELNENER